MISQIKKRLMRKSTTESAFPAWPQSPNYDNDKGVFVNHRPQQGVRFTHVLSALLEMIKGTKRFAPKSPLPMSTPDWPLFLRDDGLSRFIWFGHSSLLMRVGKQTIAVDPVVGASVSPLAFNMRRFQPPAAPLAKWPKVDIVLLSHNHYDHLEVNTLKKLAQAGAAFIVPLGVAHYFRQLGIKPVKITELDWWQAATIASLQVTLVPGLHNTGRSFSDTNKSLWGGYVLQHDKETIYYSGDSAYGPHFKQIAQRFGEINLAFIENGQYNWRWKDSHMTPEQTVQAAVDIYPQRIVPVHWGAYTMALHPWHEPVRRSVPEMRRRGLKPLTPLQGQVFDYHTETDDWFFQAE